MKLLLPFFSFQSASLSPSFTPQPHGVVVEGKEERGAGALFFFFLALTCSGQVGTSRRGGKFCSFHFSSLWPVSPSYPSRPPPSLFPTLSPKNLLFTQNLSISTPLRLRKAHYFQSPPSNILACHPENHSWNPYTTSNNNNLPPCKLFVAQRRARFPSPQILAPPLCLPISRKKKAHDALVSEPQPLLCEPHLCLVQAPC